MSKVNDINAITLPVYKRLLSKIVEDESYKFVKITNPTSGTIDKDIVQRMLNGEKMLIDLSGNIYLPLSILTGNPTLLVFYSFVELFGTVIFSKLEINKNGAYTITSIRLTGSKSPLASNNTGWGVDNDGVKCLEFTPIDVSSLSSKDLIIFTTANSFCFFGVTQTLEAHGIMSLPGLDTSVYEQVRVKFTNGKISFGSEWTADMETFNFGWQIIGIQL